jgi:hypothetical protein
MIPRDSRLTRHPNCLTDGVHLKLATGAGFSTRKLYTDTSEIIIAATRPMILNGIPELATRPDLAGRCLAIELPTIDEAHRRTEGDLNKYFTEQQPLLLGCLLNGVQSALRGRGKVKGPFCSRL